MARPTKTVRGSGNVFADIGCPEPEMHLAMADAFAAWIVGRMEFRAMEHRTEGFRAGFEAAWKAAKG